MSKNQTMNRRDFLAKAAVASAFFIVPRHVLGRGYTAPSDMLNFGFIGCGKQSGGLQSNFLKTNKVQLVAASDVSQLKLARFIERTNKFYADAKEKTNYKATEGYADFRELLARKDIDAVVIATPDHWHAAMAVRACQAGKDVYCEKPLSLTIPEGRAMVKATRDNKRVFQTGSMQRSWKEFRQAVELVRNGYIGEVKKVIANVGGAPKKWDLVGEEKPADLNWEMWLGPNTVERPFHSDVAPNLEKEAKMWPQWRNYADFGGGGMTDWGAHMFDIAQWGLDMDDSGPISVAPSTATHKDEFGEGTAGLVYTYKNGVEMYHIPQKGKQFCEFIGTKGTVWVARGELKTSPDTLKTQVIGANEKHVYLSENHYQDFLNAIKTRQNPICDVETGHRTASVCTLGNICYELKRPLTWNPKKEKFRRDAEANALLTRPMKKEWAV
jgi:predicted dehydrogenase